MAALTLDNILNGDDLKPRKFEVPEWGGSVYLIPPTCEVSEKAVDMLAGSDSIAEKMAGMRLLVFHCVTDEKGNQLFADMEQVVSRSAKSIERLGLEIMEPSSKESEEGND